MDCPHPPILARLPRSTRGPGASWCVPTPPRPRSRCPSSRTTLRRILNSLCTADGAMRRGACGNLFPRAWPFRTHAPAVVAAMDRALPISPSPGPSHPSGFPPAANSSAHAPVRRVPPRGPAARIPACVPAGVLRICSNPSSNRVSTMVTPPTRTKNGHVPNTTDRSVGTDLHVGALSTAPCERSTQVVRAYGNGSPTTSVL